VDNRPNVRLLRAAWKLEHQAAQLTTNALAVIGDRMRGIDGWGLRNGESSGRSNDTTSSTERAALARVDLGNDQREELRDRLEGLLLNIDSYLVFLRGIVAHTVDKPEPTLCGDFAAVGLRPWDGHLLVWVEYSRDPRNGWYDATCRATAGRTGLCPRCLMRMNRWRRDNDLHWVSDAPERAANV